MSSTIVFPTALQGMSFGLSCKSQGMEFRAVVAERSVYEDRSVC